MPEMQNPPMHEHHNTAESARPRPISTPSALQITLPSSVTQPSSMSASRIRNSHLGLDTFSPVNQNGSFEFDRVLKSGVVSKRTRKTKAWKSIYLVLRPNSLSIYKDSKEDKLRHKILLQDLTAVAFLKDPKQKRQNVFGLFSPSRNYHLEATSRKDAEEWVELIRTEARIEQEEEEMLLASPGGNATGTYAGFERTMQQKHEQQLLHDERLGSSSPEPSDPIIPIPRTRRSEALGSTAPRRISQTMEYSGNEVSDMSDTDVARQRGESTVSITDDTMAVKPPPPPSRPMLAARNVSQLSGFNMETSSDPERVVWQGYLMYLKSVRGVRQWKDYWAVVRPRNIALYKNDSEYSPILIIQLSNIINAVEVDPLSKTKRHCLQVITEEKSYKFCAHGEESLDTSLGALKSLLARRKEGEGKGRGVGGVVGRS
ncbi:related to PH domain protein [Rhynchosporium secalis]|uniref:Related to PH domain protein n=1 Tax=Rhynchosporium secalis TaxID=38038 RepID=A0A1E1LV19_RHYSE|nr:related to PH domain protein [Rhynchosporium secalis]